MSGDRRTLRPVPWWNVGGFAAGVVALCLALWVVPFPLDLPTAIVGFGLAGTGYLNLCDIYRSWWDR